MSFCGQCGNKQEVGKPFCGNCGQSLTEQNTNGSAKPASVVKRKRTKKEKGLLGGMIAVILLVMGGIYAGNEYTSAERTVDRFVSAVNAEDIEAIEKQLNRAGEHAVQPFEVEAMIALFETGNVNLNQLASSLKSVGSSEGFTLVEEGTFLFIFNTYQIEVNEHYYEVHIPHEEIELTIDGESINTAQADEHFIRVGPFIPGIYTIEALVTNEFGEFTHKQTASFIYGYETVYVDMNIDLVSFNMYEENEHVSILVNDTEVSLAEGSAEVGPMLIDGLSSYQIVVEYPWGEETSEPFPIDSAYQDVLLDFEINEEIEAELAEAIIEFGESYYEAFSQFDEGLLVRTSGELPHNHLATFYEVYEDNSYEYAVQLDSIDVWYEDHYLSSTESGEVLLVLPIEYDVQVNRSGLDLSDGLYHSSEACFMNLTFDKEAGWSVYDCQLSVSSWLNSGDSVSYPGSQVLHQSDDSVEIEF